MAKKINRKEVDINTKLVEELLSKADPSELFGAVDYLINLKSK